MRLQLVLMHWLYGRTSAAVLDPLNSGVDCCPSREIETLHDAAEKLDDWLLRVTKCTKYCISQGSLATRLSVMGPMLMMTINYKFTACIYGERISINS